MRKFSTKVRVFQLHLANGEWFAALSFSRDQVARFFPGARVDKDGNVYLA